MDIVLRQTNKVSMKIVVGIITGGWCAFTSNTCTGGKK
jgi:hypothetical protein